MVKLKRTVSSDINSENPSIFLSGNIHEIPCNISSLIEEEDINYWIQSCSSMSDQNLNNHLEVT